MLKFLYRLRKAEANGEEDVFTDESKGDYFKQ